MSSDCSGGEVGSTASTRKGRLEATGGERRPSGVRCVALPFETTRWSLVLAAAGNDSQAAREALSSLCQTYWYPLYAYVRRRGLDPEDARDLTQGFLTSLIERQDFEGLRQDRGRFRAFLLASLKHYLSNWSARERTQKRGGGWRWSRSRTLKAGTCRTRGSRDSRNALRAPLGTDGSRPPACRPSRAMDAQGRASEFDELKACLLGQAPAGGYAAVAARLGTSEGAVKPRCIDSDAGSNPCCASASRKPLRIGGTSTTKSVISFKR